MNADLAGFGPNDCLKKGFIGAGFGFLAGGLSGGLTRGIVDQRNGYDFWDGSGTPASFLVKDMPDAYDESPFDWRSWRNEKRSYYDALKFRARGEAGFKDFDPATINAELRVEVRCHAEVNEYGYLNTPHGQAYGSVVPYSSGKNIVCVSPKIIDAVGTEKEAFFGAVLGHEYTHAFHYYVGLEVSQTGPSEMMALTFIKNYLYRHHIPRTSLSMYNFNLLNNASIPADYYVPSQYSFSIYNHPWPIK